PSAAGPQPKRRHYEKLDSYHEGLGAPTSFLPRAARGRIKEGELRTSETVCGEKILICSRARKESSMYRAKKMLSWLFVAGLLLAVAISSEVKGQTRVTVFEGARLITGDGNTIENSAFIVENDRFTSVGRRGDVLVPAGAARVEIKGKTV